MKRTGCPLKNIRALCKAGAAAHAAGDVLNEELSLRQAHGLARALRSPVLEGKILNTMGLFALENGKAGDAVHLLQEARQKVAGRVGTENRLHAVITNNLEQARARRDQARVGSASGRA